MNNTRCRASKLLFCILFTVAVYSGAPVVYAQTDSSADRQFNAISRLIEKADRAIEAGKEQEATKLYGATIAAYRDFSTNFPEHQSELVQFRVSYCRNQLMGLLAAKQVPGAAAKATATELSPEMLRVQEAIENCKNGEFDTAKMSMDSVIEANPDCATAYLVLATVCLGKGDVKAARVFVERVLALDPGCSSAHYNLAQLIIRDTSPDFDQARDHYQNARRLGAPSDTDLESVLNL